MICVGFLTIQNIIQIANNSCVCVDFVKINILLGEQDFVPPVYKLSRDKLYS